MYDLIKSVIDRTLAAVLLVAVAPLMLVISISIKLTSQGPIFFRQIRVGKDGRPFAMYKFRTMRVNLDQSAHHDYVSELVRGTYGDVERFGAFKIASDPRVTRVGLFLRKTALDELPNFWNVLAGDMSLVGPRPPLPYEVEQYQEWHMERLKAKPGITGLWQVQGRSRTTFDEMVRLDILYIRQRSIWLDLKILFETPLAVLKGKGAA